MMMACLRHETSLYVPACLHQFTPLLFCSGCQILYDFRYPSKYAHTHVTLPFRSTLSNPQIGDTSLQKAGCCEVPDMLRFSIFLFPLALSFRC